VHFKLQVVAFGFRNTIFDVQLKKKYFGQKKKELCFQLNLFMASTTTEQSVAFKTFEAF
jgi:hypothetical protein